MAATMNSAERELLNAETDGAEPHLILRTDTYVDAGRWLRSTPLWLCVMDDEILVLAASRRCFVEATPIEECRETWYCHTTGELVLAPKEGLEQPRLAMSPVDALKVLDELKAALAENG